MKKHFLILLLSFIFIKFAAAQLLCVRCYDQNDSIGVNVGKNNLIVNGGFENCNCGFNSNWNTFCSNSPFHSCDIDSWNCTGGGSASYPHFYDNKTEFVEEGKRSPYFGNLYSKLVNGNKKDTAYWNGSGCEATHLPAIFAVSDIAYGGPAGLSLSQTVKGLTPGSTYVLEFWAGGGSDINGAVTNNGLFAVDVGFGNTFLNNKPTPIGIGVGTRYLIAFKATSKSHTIKFTTWRTICTNCAELILDNVRLYTPAFLPKTIPLCAPQKKEKTEDKMEVVTNKETKQIIITFIEEQKNTNIKLINSKGKTIIGMNVTGKQLLLDSSEMKKGKYTVQVTDEKNNIIKSNIVLE